MAGPKIGSGGTKSGMAIPPSDRKLVQNLKEILPNSEEEIYAMLRECNMDPDETVQRLLSEDTFHVVKRKRDKKKEVISSRDSLDRLRSASAGLQSRTRKTVVSVDRSFGRGIYPPNTNDLNQHKTSATRENGVYNSSKSQNAVSSSLPYAQQLKGTSGAISDMCFPATSNAVSLPGLQGAWAAGTGHLTMAEVVKSNQNGVQMHPTSGPPLHLRNSSDSSVRGVYSSTSDPIFNPSLDSTGSLRYDVGNQQPAGDCIPTTFASSDWSTDVQASDPSSNADEQSLGMEHADALDHSQNQTLATPNDFLLGLSVPRSIPIPNQADTVQLPQVHDYNGAETGTIVNSDWSSNLPAQDQISTEASTIGCPGLISPDSSAPMPEAEVLSNAVAAKLQQLNLQDDQLVTIPDHLRVSDADCTKLTFGSFGEDLCAGFQAPCIESNLTLDSVEEVEQERDETVTEQTTTSGTESHTSVTLANRMSSPGNAVDVVSSIEATESSVPETAAPVSELRNMESLGHQNPQYNYLSTIPNYPGHNLVPQIQGRQQYPIEPMESRPVDISRLSNVLPSYSDTANYYSAAFRPKSEGDARYAAFLATTLAGKYDGSTPAATVQNGLPQESTDTPVMSNSGSLVQGPQSLTGQNIMTNSQQTIPIHPYAAQPSALPLGPFANVFGYQYLPSGGFPYFHSPYQQNYASNSTYHQVPAGNTYPQAGAAASKYAMSQQYKSSVASGATGAVAATSTGTMGGNPGYDDAFTTQGKDNTLYMQGQQVDGSALWFQTQLSQAQLSRDMAGLQGGNSGYSIPGQSQHTTYSHAQPSHGHAFPVPQYASLYQRQQSGPTPTAHQLLYPQPQVGNQIGSFPQTQQRAQQSRTNNF